MIPDVHDAEAEGETPDFEDDDFEDAVESQQHEEDEIIASDNDSNVDLEEDILPTNLKGQPHRVPELVNIRRSRPFTNITNAAQHNRGGTAGTSPSAVLDLDLGVVEVFQIPDIVVEGPSTSISWLDLEAHDFHPISPPSSFPMDEEVFEGVGECDNELRARPTAPCYSLSRYQFPPRVLPARASRQNLFDSNFEGTCVTYPPLRTLE